MCWNKENTHQHASIVTVGTLAHWCLHLSHSTAVAVQPDRAAV